MEQPILGTSQVVQVAIIVKNIEVTASAYANFFAVPVPEISIAKSPPGKKTYYRGEDSNATAKLAFFDIGPNLQLELIEPDEKPSTWREHLDEKGEGVHHIAFQVKDMDEKLDKLAKRQMETVQTGSYEGGKYGYVDTLADLKVVLELLENE